jgi:hypothetical protein
MADASTAPGAHTVDVPVDLDPAAVEMPDGDGSDRDVGQELTVLGVSGNGPSWWALLISTYGYLLPLILYASWVSVAVWDLVRRDDASVGVRAAWMAGVLIVPVVGPVAYYALGRSRIPGALRLMLVLGGLVVYAAFAALAFVVSS